MDRAEHARRLRHYGLELLQLAATMEAEDAQDAATLTGRDNLGRLRCCGAGPDQRDTRTGEDLHLPGCAVVAGPGLAACRTALDGGHR
jgi:hypothetical protein